MTKIYVYGFYDFDEEETMIRVAYSEHQLLELIIDKTLRFDFIKSITTDGIIKRVIPKWDDEDYTLKLIEEDEY